MSIPIESDPTRYVHHPFCYVVLFHTNGAFLLLRLSNGIVDTKKKNLTDLFLTLHVKKKKERRRTHPMGLEKRKRKGTFLSRFLDGKGERDRGSTERLGKGTVRPLEPTK